MTNFNKNYKYLTQNRCDDCNKFYPKGLAILGNNGVHRCHICNQKLRLKPKRKMSSKYKEIILTRPSVEFIYCKCGCGKTRPKYRWYNRVLGRLRPNKPAKYINGHYKGRFIE